MLVRHTAPRPDLAGSPSSAAIALPYLCLAELDCEKAEITVQLSEAPADVPDAHPGIAKIYKRKVAALAETLEDPNTWLGASSDIRSLVGKIVLHPGSKRGEVHATLLGSLMGILDFVNDHPQPRATRLMTKVSPGSLGTTDMDRDPLAKTGRHD